MNITEFKRDFISRLIIEHQYCKQKGGESLCQMLRSLKSEILAFCAWMFLDLQVGIFKNEDLGCKTCCLSVTLCNLLRVTLL